jgi:all-trans-retinol 13,14-reductase
MKNYQTYKEFKKSGFNKEKYDAIIIGSGISGLTTASVLASNGKKVLLLEKHYMPGGFTHTFKRKKWLWDVGLHYIGEAHVRGTETERLLHNLSGGNLKWESMGEVYDKIIFGNKTYEFRTGIENFTAKMSEYFPKEQETIRKYITVVKDTVKKSRFYFVDKALPPFLSSTVGEFLKRPFYRFSDRTTLNVLSEITENKELIGVLTGQWGDIGLPPGLSSFAIHSMVANHYFSGGAYPVGGSAKIFQTFSDKIIKNGGKIAVQAGVKNIILHDNLAVGVRLEDGEEIYGGMVISSAGVINSFTKFIEPQEEFFPLLDSYSKKISLSSGHLCLYLGFNKTAKELNFEKPNLWIYPESSNHDENIDKFLKNPESEIPVIYASFPSAKDPDWENSHPGISTLELITMAPFEWFQKWENTGIKTRTPDYDNFKNRLSERVLEKAYNYLPRIKGNIEHIEISTGLSTRYYCSYDKGEIYGLNHTPERFRQKWLRPVTPIKNYYLTGQDISTCGIMGALAGGVLTASAILKRNVMAELISGKY